jgi:ADP-dependent NAD(P)H-hydrate dehydratase / NAD(P)H-hydrate epimerase
LLKPRDETDDNLARVQALGLEVLLSTDDHRFRGLYHRLRSCQILIDALLGTGAARPITGQLASIMEQVRAGIDERTNFQNNSPTLVSIASLTGAGTSEATADNRPAIIAVDCPSGMNCETGELDPLAIPAELTVSFAGPKRGHFLFPGAAACGELVVADIGIDARLPEVAQVPVELATLAEMRRLLPKRPADGHKGTFGTTLIAAGSIRYWGAPALAARGAFRAGTGLVTLAVPQRLRPALAGQFPEATYPPVTDTDLLGVSTANLLLSSLKAYRSILVGPGLGEAGSFIHALLDGLREPLEGSAAPPLVVDADGLNLLAETADWPSRLPAQSILTPHPAEMARLIGRSRSPVQPAERIDLAREKAAEWGQIVVLKGAYTIIAAPTATAQFCRLPTRFWPSRGAAMFLPG